MKITIQSLHFTPGKELNEYIQDNVGKLSHFYDRIESVNVCLKSENDTAPGHFVCEMRLVVPGNDLFAKKEGKSFEEAITRAADALKHQIIKMKATFHNHV